MILHKAYSPFPLFPFSPIPLFLYFHHMKFKYVTLLLFLLFSVACRTQNTDQQKSPEIIPDSVVTQMLEQKKQIAGQMQKAKLEYFIINVPENQFGYYIMIDGQMYIEQKTIPAIQGLKGFKTKEQAEAVAQRVIEKIKEGEMPPTIEIRDLDSLKIEY